MRNSAWKRWMVVLLSGSMLLQAPGCTETAAVVTAISTAVSAAGVIYLVRQVID